MKNYIHCLKERRSERSYYFREAAKTIAEDNLHTAFAASVRTLLLLIVFLTITPFIIKGWSPSRYHLLFVPAILLCCGLTFWGKRKNFRGKEATALCILYILVAFLFLFLIDTLGTPENVACFIPVVYVGLFPLFTLPLWLSYSLLLSIEVCFVIAVILVKPSAVSQYDVFISLVGTVCSILMNNLILSLRMQAYQKQIKYKQMSELDTLSSVYNKRSGIAAASHYVRHSNPDTTCSLFILDVDDFKAVNDTTGHQAGDHILRCVGEILLHEFRNTDIIVRFGGDEFMVLMKDVASDVLARRKAKNIQNAIRFQSLEKIGTAVSVSIGVVLVKKKNADFDELFRQVDTALYHSKSIAGKNHITLREYHTR